MKRRILFALGVGLLTGLVLAMIGVQIEFACGWGVLAVGAAIIARLPAFDDPRADAPGRPEEQTYVGSDVSRLAWAINMHTDTVSEAVTRRVRATLRRRLARHGLDPDVVADGTAIEERLGAGLWARLNGHRTTTTDIRDALAAAERLAPTLREDAT